ncbi:hypothetical protein ASD80_10075 [Devosia sp. Root635]|nr:hypothetical protein ASD80_10075 [Devosia sp. Root635]
MALSWIARGAASAERGRRLMALRGITPNGHPLWEDREVGPLVDLHPRYGAVFPVLPRRTKPAVYSKAARLGLTKSRAPWSDNEILRLRIYRSGTREEVLAAFPGRSWRAIGLAANKRGHRRQKPPAQTSGIDLIDQIYSRAQLLGVSLTNLDAIVRRKGYFARRKWRRKQDHGAHGRAIAALGGHLRARFADGQA